MTCKTFTGNRYSFCIKGEKTIGPGGNSKVYEIELLNPPDRGRYVVKFFHCNKDEYKDQRYSRFMREIDFLESNSDIPGILPLLDKCCPKTPDDENTAWYIMPKANFYSVKSQRTLRETIENILPLAKTIRTLHEKKWAHRDIKPENILFHQNRLYLVDFGLLWKQGEKRLTIHEERIGPYKILPPELTLVNPQDDSVDFCASDVYLFAKVLWMMLMRDNEGFSGPYDRKRGMVYLPLDHYSSEVSTLEPLHQMFEQTTIDDFHKRITMDECIDFLETQLCLIQYNEKPHQYWQIKTDSFIFSEKTKYIVERNEPTVKEYFDKRIILDTIQGVFNYSNVIIKQIAFGDDKPAKLSLSSFEPEKNNGLLFKCYKNNILIEQFRLLDYSMRYYPDTEEVELVPGDPGDRKEQDEIYYSPGLSVEKIPSLRKYLLTQNERLVFSKKEVKFETFN